MIKDNRFPWWAWLAMGGMMLVYQLAQAGDKYSNVPDTTGRVHMKDFAELLKIEAQSGSELKELNPDDIFDRVLIEADGMVVPTSLRRPVPCPPTYCPPIVPPSAQSESVGGSEMADTRTSQPIENLQRTDSGYTQPDTTRQDDPFDLDLRSTLTMRSTSVPGMLGDFFGTGGIFEILAPRSFETKMVYGISPYNRLLNIENGRGRFGNVQFTDAPYGAGNVVGALPIISQAPIVDMNGQALLGAWSDTTGVDLFPIVADGNNVLSTQEDANGIVTTEMLLNGVAVLSQTYDDPPDGLITPQARGMDNTDQFGNVIDDSIYNPADPGDDFNIVGVAGTITSGRIQVPISPTSGRVKLAENSSPLPQDRILFNYSMFSGVDLAPGGINVNRFTPGFEKTFWGGNASLELRVPFSTTINSDIVAGQNGAISSGLNDVEFGDVTSTLKFLWFSDGLLTTSYGFGLSFPTSDGISYSTEQGNKIFSISNDSVHFMPYVGAVLTPGPRLFWQTIVQFDIPLNGNPVDLNTDPFDIAASLPNVAEHAGMQRIGRLDDPVFLHVSTSLGYWIYRTDACDLGWKRGLTGIAGMFEVHYNQTMTYFDQVEGQFAFTDQTFVMGDNTRGLTQTNITAGAIFEFNADTSLSFGYATPVTSDRVFNGEFRCSFTHLFGRSARRSVAGIPGLQTGNRSL